MFSPDRLVEVVVHSEQIISVVGTLDYPYSGWNPRETPYMND
jgi:hypothetical protein